MDKPVNVLDQIENTANGDLVDKVTTGKATTDKVTTVANIQSIIVNLEKR